MGAVLRLGCNEIIYQHGFEPILRQALRQAQGPGMALGTAGEPVEP